MYPGKKTLNEHFRRAGWARFSIVSQAGATLRDLCVMVRNRIVGPQKGVLGGEDEMCLVVWNGNDFNKLPDNYELGDEWFTLLAHVAESSRYFHKFAIVNSFDNVRFGLRVQYQKWMRQSNGYLRVLGGEDEMCLVVWNGNDFNKLPDNYELGDEWFTLLAHVAELSRYFHKFAIVNSVDHVRFGLREQ